MLLASGSVFVSALPGVFLKGAQPPQLLLALDCINFDQFLLVCVISPHAVTAIRFVFGGVMNCIHQLQLPWWESSS